MTRCKQLKLLKLNKWIVLVILYKILVLDAYSQIIIQNPSFEGTTGISKVPTPWVMCSGSPDTQPKGFGTNLSASNGNTFLGMVDQFDHGFQEATGQMLSTNLIAGKSYFLNLDLLSANLIPYPGIRGELHIYGGMISCSQDELLWKSDTIKNEDAWKTYTAIFTPLGNYSYIILVAYNLNGISDSYILVDNLSPEIKIAHKISILNPTENTYQSCQFIVSGKTDSIPSSIQVTGKFIGSPVSATFNSLDSSWQASVSYSEGFVGKDSIIAIGSFANGWIASDTVILNVLSPKADFTYLADCEKGISITNTSIGKIVKWHWDFGDSDTSNMKSPIHTYLNAAEYTLTLTIEDSSNCTSSLVKEILATANPSADFTYIADCEKGISIANTSVGKIKQWHWDFGDGDTSNIKSPIHTYLNAGDYTVTLNIKDPSNCASSLTEPIVVRDCEIKIPNLITPNGDGKNDVFEIKNLPANSQLEIYNRWGEKVFESEDYKNNWKGEEDGIYFYHLKMNENQLKGWLHINR